MRRVLSLSLASVVWLALSTTPAAAHGSAGLVSSNYRTDVTAVTPDIPGITVLAIESGSRIEVINTTDEELVVLGYGEAGKDGEPYLRIGPQGVFQNKRSPSVYLNTSRTPGALPPEADSRAAPEWEKIASEPVARWHDHRTHWMSPQNPPAVQREPGKRHTIISDWKVQMQYAGQPVVASGDLHWIPGPAPLPWLVLALLILAGTAAIALSPQWTTLLAAALLLAAVVDLLSTFGFVLAAAGTTVGSFLVGGLPALLAAGTGIVGAVWLLKGKREGIFIGLIAALFVGVFGGVLEFAALSSSQVPFAMGAVPGRALVAVSLGLGFGILVATGVILTRKEPGVGRPTEEYPGASMSA